jgi:subtilisin-like proprotein convertase family protein
VTVRTPVSLSITGTSQINENSSATYTATLYYSDGGSNDVTPTWSENSSYASVNTGGTVTTSDVPSNQSFTLTATYSGFTATKTITIIGEIISIPDPPSGPSTGNINVLYTFSTGGSSSNLGHSIQYRFIWGDGTTSSWSTSTSASHSWSSRDGYVVRAEARCATHTSEESTFSFSAGITIYQTGTNIMTVYCAVPIPDNGGLANHASQSVTLSGAPSGAMITSVDVEYDIDHTYIGDLRVWLTTYESNWIDGAYLWNRQGGSADNIVADYHSGLSYWNGLDANRVFYLAVSDNAAGDVGCISRIKIWVHWRY